MAQETPSIAVNGRYAKELKATVFTGRAARSPRAARHHAWGLGVGSAEISVLDGQLSGEGVAGQEETPVSSASEPPVACQETIRVSESVPANWPGCWKVSPQT